MSLPGPPLRQLWGPEEFSCCCACMVCIKGRGFVQATLSTPLGVRNAAIRGLAVDDGEN